MMEAVAGIAVLLTALGAGGLLQTALTAFLSRRKTPTKTDVEFLRELIDRAEVRVQNAELGRYEAEAEADKYREQVFEWRSWALRHKIILDQLGQKPEPFPGEINE